MSLISHLIGQYAPSPENAATEAVAYVLQRSEVASATLTKLLAQAAPGLPSPLLYRTQAASLDNALPDLEGVAGSGLTAALVEAKFWAGLTDNQPVAYLKRFSAGSPGVLAFLAPAKRFVTLWPEISGRIQDAGLKTGPLQQISAEYWHVSLESGHQLAIFSWRLLIDTLTNAMTAANQHREAADLEQIRDLCDRMDSDAFAPFTQEELSDQWAPRRYRQIYDLGLDLGKAVKAEGLATDKDGNGRLLTTGQGNNYNGTYLRLADAATFFIGYDLARWAEFGVTPFWIRFHKSDPTGQKLARERLSKLQFENPPRFHDFQGEPCVPLRVPAGRERHEIVKAVLLQVADLKTRLQGPLADAAQ